MYHTYFHLFASIAFKPSTIYNFSTAISSQLKSSLSHLALCSKWWHWHHMLLRPYTLVAIRCVCNSLAIYRLGSGQKKNCRVTAFAHCIRKTLAYICWNASKLLTIYKCVKINRCDDAHRLIDVLRYTAATPMMAELCESLTSYRTGSPVQVLVYTSTLWHYSTIDETGEIVKMLLGFEVICRAHKTSTRLPAIIAH